MSEPDRELERPFTFAYPTQLRWSDFDGLGHVNNAVYLTFVEAARVAYQAQVIGAGVQEQPWVVAEQRCRYLVPVNLPALGKPATVYLRVQRLGTSSLIFAFAVTVGVGDEETRVAEGDVVQVHISPETHRPTPISPAWRAIIEQHEATHAT